MTKLSSLLNKMAFISLTLLMSCNNSKISHPSHDLINNQNVGMEDLKKEFDEVSREFVDLFNSGDTKALANMFTDDAKSMGPNEPSHLGIRNIEITYRNIINSGAVKAKITTIGVMG